jgi:hypothetical protein
VVMVVLSEHVVDILGEWLGCGVCESRRSERQGKENGRELHDCGEGVARSMCSGRAKIDTTRMDEWV